MPDPSSPPPGSTRPPASGPAPAVARRSVLRGLGHAALLGTAVAPLLGAAPDRIVASRPTVPRHGGATSAPPQRTSPGRRPARGARVGGPLGDIYGRYGEPRGIALAQTAALDSTRTVSWLSSGELDPGTEVRYGIVESDARPADIRSGALLDHAVRGGSVLAPFGSFDRDAGESTGAAPGEVPVRVHRATLSGLRPGQRIAYQVGGTHGWSDVRTFTVPARRDGFRFTHVGDHGTTVAAERLTRAVRQLDPNLHLLAGDLSYANGLQPTWDRWSSQLEPLAAEVPVLFAPGNHEAQDFFGETYRRRFARPDPNVAWYGLDIGNVHVTSTTAGALIAGANTAAGVRELLLEELTFLERDLADAAARRADGELDLIVVLQHYPLFTEHRTRGPFSPELVLLEEQLLQRYAVDLVLCGHDHQYQRSRPMVGGSPTGRDGGGGIGYVQVAAGAGGKSLYEFTPIDLLSPRVDPENPLQRRALWAAARRREFSFVSYDVDGPELTATAYGWDDVPGQDVIPDLDRYDEDLVRVDPDGVDPDLAPRVIDRFTVRRKPRSVVAAAGLAPLLLNRLTSPLLRRLPELNGVVRADPAEDCTRH